MIKPFGLLTFCVLALASLTSAWVITTNASDIAGKTFSYVIVGGGTAGLTLANRLTENANITVLVIEAGKDMKDDPLVTDPGTFAIVDPTPLEWGYISTNQSINDKTQALGAGKVLGGSSAINGMQWMRGTVGQYDAFEELGNPGWNFASLQSYMRKAEQFHKPTPLQTSLNVTFQPPAHGFTGPLNTGFPNPYPCPLCDFWQAFISATGSVIPNFPTQGIDQCSGNPRGAARCAFSLLPGETDDNGVQIKPNVRSSSVRGYIYSLPREERDNLSILVEHQAEKIIWEEKNAQEPKPKGVAFQATNDASITSVVYVNKEVIVSCGTVGSPLFLERSGIGDKVLLESLNISVLADLPAIGRNLQDQSGIDSAYLPSFQLNSTQVNYPPTAVSVFASLKDVLGEKEADAYVQQLQDTLSERAKQIVSEGSGVVQIGVERMLQMQLKQFGSLEAPVVELVYGAIPSATQGLVGVITWILLPQYRGTVHISSADLHSQPIINPHYLSTPLDFSLLVNATILTRNIVSQPSAKAFYSAELIPGPGVQTPDQFASYIHDNYTGTDHLIGSVSMLPRELGGAVDANLSVYGVQGVRVVDASILPLQISAHPSSTVYGIAEKAADLIKSSW